MALLPTHTTVRRSGRSLPVSLLIAGLVILGGIELLADLKSNGATTVRTASVVARRPNVAYDDKNNVYLQVWGDEPAAFGQLVKPDGTLLGPRIKLNCPTCTYGQSPFVVYTAGSTDDVFIVVMSTDKQGPGTKTLWLQLVKYTSAGAQLVGGNVQVSSLNYATATSIVYDRIRQQFLAVWTEYKNGDYDVFSRVFSLTRSGGVVTGIGAGAGVLSLSNSTAFHQGNGAGGFDPIGGNYFVAFKGGMGSQSEGIWGRVINPVTNTMSAFTTLATGGYQVEPNVIYLPNAQKFLVIWTTSNGSLNVVGRLVTPSTGQPSGNTFPILATSASESAARGAFSSSAAKVLIGAMHHDQYIRGVELSATGTVVRSFRASTPVPATTGGSFHPHVAAGEGGQFGLSFILNNLKVYLERLSDNGSSSSQPSTTTKPITWIDSPKGAQQVGTTFNVVGWAVDLVATPGTGIDDIKVFSKDITDSGAASGCGNGAGWTFEGDAEPINRPDVAKAFGSTRFTPSGFWRTVGALTASATYDIEVCTHSAGAPSTAWNSKVVRVTVP